jgi:sarcosine oxidase
VRRERFDAIVVGVGGMGSAALFELARRGRRVLGLERFSVPHDFGSSHGVTRIIRLAYYEDPAYVPLLRRAYELWRELEGRARERLLYITGSVDAGPEVFEGSLRSCQEHELAHEVLSGSELGRRYAGYRLPDSIAVLLQPEGGFLLPERCIVAYAREAEALGAVIRTGERVLDWEPIADGVRVRSDQGLYEADRLVLCAGAWSQSVARLPAGFVRAERQVLAWFEPLEPELFQPECFPVFNVVVPEGRWYGFPVFGPPGVKVGRYHHRGEVVEPDSFDREPNREDELLLRAFVERYLPAGAGPTAALKTCLFENSPDEHFLLDLHPDCPQAVVAAGFSGHGFKFCSVVGEIVAELVLTGRTRHEIGFLRLARFAGAGEATEGSRVPA